MTHASDIRPRNRGACPDSARFQDFLEALLPTGVRHRQLKAAKHDEVDGRGSQPGGDPGQRYPKSTGRRWCASHDDGVTMSVRNPFSGAL